MKKPLAIILAFLPLICSTNAEAQTTTGLGAAKDNTLFESATGSLSAGADAHLFAGKTNSGLIRRAVIGYDLQGSIIPPNAIILNVSLTLQMNQTSSGPKQINLHRITNNWGEGTSVSSGGGGGGGPASLNDATWLHTFHSSSFWTNPGGDFIATPSATSTVDQPGNYTWTGPGMIADMQDWILNPGGNFGWILVGDESANNTAKRFLSREGGGGAPSLTVTFMDPCIDPEIPAAATFTICNGQSANVSINANLNDATAWAIYTGSCGGNFIDFDPNGNFTLSPQVTTTYYVRGEGGCVNSGACGEFTIEVESVVANVTQNSGTLTANTIAGATYQWLKCTSPPTLVQNETSQSFTPGTSGNYAVVVTNASGCSDTSNCFSVTVASAADQLTKKIRLYPNPTSGLVRIEFPEIAENATVELLNLEGKSMFSGKFSDTKALDITLPKLPHGLYFVRVRRANMPDITEPLQVNY